jgi:acetyl-CoA carboxylase biotin carboxyl carrier protein
MNRDILLAKGPLVDILIRSLTRSESGRLGLLPMAIGVFLPGNSAMAEKKDHDLRRIEQLIEIMKENDLLEVEITRGDDKIFLKRSEPLPLRGLPPGVTTVPAPIAIGTGTTEPNAVPIPSGLAPKGLVEISSPLVGTFYSAPSPDSEPYIEAGSRVEPETVVCIIEAMKVMNEVKAEVTGSIVEVLVKTGQAVEYGQSLFKVKPD